MQEIVKYHNDLNKIKLPDFNEQEQNLFMSILTLIKNRKADTDKAPFLKLYQDDLISFSKKNLTDREFSEIVESFKKKLFHADFTILVKEKDLKGKMTIHMFEYFIVWTQTKYYTEFKNDKTPLTEPFERFDRMDIKVSPYFSYLVNELKANFTNFELAEFISLSGKYTKTLYRQLKQYRSTGYFKMEWDKFKEIMDIPKDYNQSNIDTWILKPAIRELTKERNLFDMVRIPFENLSYTKIKGKGRGRGGNVIGIEFSFKPQKPEDFYIPTKNQKIKALEAQNTEYVKEIMQNNLAMENHSEVVAEKEKLEKRINKIGYSGYLGLRYESEKGEIIELIELAEIQNSSDSSKLIATMQNKNKNTTFNLYFESLKHLINTIQKNASIHKVWNNAILN